MSLPRNELEEEFGVARDDVQYHDRRRSDESDQPCAVKLDADDGTPGACQASPRSPAQWRRLRKRLWHRRWLRQYFSAPNVLVREREKRRIHNEELYLDLVIVANIAALGHELRETFGGWDAVEKFILLFGPVSASWRTLIILWNLYGTLGDLVDKFGIYATHTAMSGIGLGAHGAFSTAQKQVGICAFLATAIPAVSIMLFAWMEPASINEHNLFSQAVGLQVVNVLSVLPYLIAAFVDSERVAKILYWVALVSCHCVLPIYVIGYRHLHRNRPLAVRTAVNVESMVEKYGVFTLVVLGESLLALIFEGSTLVTLENANINKMYVTVAVSVLIVYSLQTLYFNVDNFIAKGGVHAIRAHRHAGLAWTILHLFYHMALAGPLATGLGLIIRDVTLEGSKKVVRAAAEGASKTGSLQMELNSNGRWLFSAGWGIALMTSTIMGLFHRAGPRAKTKRFRLLLRTFVTIVITVAIPFAKLNASTTLIVYSVIITMMALLEFVLIEADRIGMLSPTAIKSSTISSERLSMATDDMESSDSEKSDSNDNHGSEKASGDAEAGIELDEDGVRQEQTRLAALQRRQKYRRKFEAVFNAKKIHRHCAETH